MLSIDTNSIHILLTNELELRVQEGCSRMPLVGGRAEIWIQIHIISCIFHCCYNKQPQFQWQLKQKFMLHFSKLEALCGSQWSTMVVLAGLCSSLKALGENRFPCFFQLLEAANLPWLMSPSLASQSHFPLTPLFCLPLLPEIALASLGQPRALSLFQCQLAGCLNSICHLNSPLSDNVFPGSCDQDIDILGGGRRSNILPTNFLKPNS